MHNNRHSIQVPCKFQINRFINNREVDDPNTRAVDDQGTRAVDDPSIRVVDDPVTRGVDDPSTRVVDDRLAVDDPSKGQRRAVIAALHASKYKFGQTSVRISIIRQERANSVVNVPVDSKTINTRKLNNLICSE